MRQGRYPEEYDVSRLFAPLSESIKTATMMIPCNDPDTLPFEVDLPGEGILDQ